MTAASPEPHSRDLAADAARWLTPIQAAAYAAQIFGSEKASDAIWERLIGGMIETIASTSSVTDGDGRPIATKEPSLIPNHYWKHISQHGSDLWGAGDARFFLTARSIHRAESPIVRCFGIKLNPNDVRETLPPLPPEGPRRWPPKREIESVAQASKPKIDKGGRPRKEWWDDFWIEICRRIWMGDLKPKTQADLARAMFEWVENHPGTDAGETTINAAARKLFKAWDLRSKT